MPPKAARTSITDLTPGSRSQGSSTEGVRGLGSVSWEGDLGQGALLAARPQLSSVSRHDRAISPTGCLPGSEATWTCEHLAD